MCGLNGVGMFQHTAARRRLRQYQSILDLRAEFQHTAARRRLRANTIRLISERDGFNTQPPEGGCTRLPQGWRHRYVSTHSRPKAAAP